MSHMVEDGEVCTCGFDSSSYKPEQHHLKPGTVLKERYLIGTVIGQGGFGITYVGYDQTLQIKVAIKEFFLSGFVSRNHTVADNIAVSVGDNRKLFEGSKKKFLEEAQNLAKFEEENGIVRVRDCFEANNTVYIVMNFLEGMTLHNYLKKKGTLSWDETLKLLTPIMDVLEKIHKTGLIHRDISPDNIMLLKDGSVKLFDFGASRAYASHEMHTESMVLKPGYAPIEQYSKHGVQGPFTDIYALCATMYVCLCGQEPPESLNRLAYDYPLVNLCEVNRTVTKEAENMIYKGLAVRSTDRPQNISELRILLEKSQEDPTVWAKPVTQIPEKESRVPEENVSIKAVQEPVVNVIASSSQKTESGPTDNSSHSSGSSGTDKKKTLIPLLVTVLILAIVGGAGAFLLPRILEPAAPTAPVAAESTPVPKQTAESAVESAVKPNIDVIIEPTVRSVPERLKNADVDIRNITKASIDENTFICEDSDHQYTLELPSRSFDLAELKDFTSLNSISLRSAENIQLSGELASLRTLQAYDSHVENLQSLCSLGLLEQITLNRCNLTSVDPLADCSSLQYAEIIGNPISDYRPLGAIKNVKITESATLEHSYDPNINMVHVTVSNLRIRSTPGSTDDKNLTGKKCVEDAYYIIIGEHRTSDGQMWYRIGNDQWIAEGDWMEVLMAGSPKPEPSPAPTAEIKDNYSIEEILDLFDSGEDALVYFYNYSENYEYCPWCETTDRAVRDLEKETGRHVYWCMTRDSKGNFTYSNSVAAKLPDYLDDDHLIYGDKIAIPVLMHIRDGKVISSYRITCDAHNDSCPVHLTSNEYKALMEAYQSVAQAQ